MAVTFRAFSVGAIASWQYLLGLDSVVWFLQKTEAIAPYSGMSQGAP
ncbi:hypothetical protein [[Limnothrix rosea] IAM M-220]|nr:hypothetical protein [[Limnothrix rosea] IAM M-220]